MNEEIKTQWIETGEGEWEQVEVEKKYTSPYKYHMDDNNWK